MAKRKSGHTTHSSEFRVPPYPQPLKHFVSFVCVFCFVDAHVVTFYPYSEGRVARWASVYTVTCSCCVFRPIGMRQRLVRSQLELHQHGGRRDPLCVRGGLRQCDRKQPGLRRSVPLSYDKLTYHSNLSALCEKFLNLTSLLFSEPETCANVLCGPNALCRVNSVTNLAECICFPGYASQSQDPRQFQDCIGKVHLFL